MEFQDDELQEILNIFNVESEEIISRLNDNLMALEKSPTNKDVLILLALSRKCWKSPELSSRILS